MLSISRPNYIKCSFTREDQATHGLYTGLLDIFFAETKDLIIRYPDIKKYISFDEQLKADKFHFDDDRETYVLCHALLRLVLANHLNVNPLEIKFKIGLNNKPCLTNDAVYFNVTHTKEAFSFAVSKNFYVGIDLEDINQPVEINSIAESFFSKREREYIFKSNTDAKNRFFLLWTRKEALLKAIGTGISDNLTQIEVSEQENYINKKSFENLVLDSVSDEHFIYSMNFKNYSLSIAVPGKVTINLYHLNIESINLYLD